jgi:hypothetical protein
MKRVNDPMNKQVRRICRDINNRSDDRQQLEILMIKLQEVLREERHDIRAVEPASRSDNPFDAIMMG